MDIFPKSSLVTTGAAATKSFQASVRSEVGAMATWKRFVTVSFCDAR